MTVSIKENQEIKNSWAQINIVAFVYSGLFKQLSSIFTGECDGQLDVLSVRLSETIWTHVRKQFAK